MGEKVLEKWWVETMGEVVAGLEQWRVRGVTGSSSEQGQRPRV